MEWLRAGFFSNAHKYQLILFATSAGRRWSPSRGLGTTGPQNCFRMFSKRDSPRIVLKLRTTVDDEYTAVYSYSKPAAGLPSLNQSAPHSGSYPLKQPPASLNEAAPRSGSSTKAASSLPPLSSPAQWELFQKQPPPSLNQAAPHSESFPRCRLLPPSIEQPRAAGAPPEVASSLPESSSPAQ